MGSFRGGIILSFLAAPALAEVCDKERPGWDGTPATAVTEAIALFSTPLGLFLLIATAITLRFRNAWGGLATTVGWTGFITIVVSADPSGVQGFAISEGCIGPPTLFVALSIAICIVTIIYTARGKPGTNERRE